MRMNIKRRYYTTLIHSNLNQRKTSLLQLVHGESGSLNQSGYINAV